MQIRHIRDELDDLIDAHAKGSLDRRSFVKRVLALGITMPSISAFIASLTRPETALAATPPAGDPVDITVGFFPTWEGGASGVVVKHRELWKKYLPKGSKVSWDAQIVGPPIVTNLLANKNQIGYLGDTPAMVSTTKRDIADIRMVECNLFSPTGQMCGFILVSKSAPDFADFREFTKWLNGKTIGVSGKGSCGDRMVAALLEKSGAKANVAYLAPTIIKTSLMANKVDAVQAFQPHTSQIVDQKIGKIVATGSIYGVEDASFIIMRKDFIDNHAEAAKGWVKADLEALKFMLTNPYETVKYLGAELPGFSTMTIWKSIYGQYDPKFGGKPVNTIAQASFSPDVLKFIDFNVKFLNQRGVLKTDKLPEGAVYDKLVKEAASELGFTFPLGTIKGQPESAFRK
ncbi:MAG: ABC transporter substrate-binding protein [Pseudolabrys sp.]|jgi:ABC-type nitrate/sulfonate/bicarbonate transport system substrate-binding protein